MFETHGFILEEVIKEARKNGNEEFAKLIEAQIANIQVIYNALSQKYTSTNGKDVWDIDADYVRSQFK